MEQITTEQLPKWSKSAAKCIARIRNNSPNVPAGTCERLSIEEQRRVIQYAVAHWRTLLATMDALIAKSEQNIATMHDQRASVA